jgi:hypothetical protein
MIHHKLYLNRSQSSHRAIIPEEIQLFCPSTLHWSSEETGQCRTHRMMALLALQAGNSNTVQRNLFVLLVRILANGTLGRIILPHTQRQAHISLRLLPNQF